MRTMMPDSLTLTFAALADPTRRAILAHLAVEDASVTDLAMPFDMSMQAIAKHLKVLERAGLISRSRDAQRRPRHIEGGPLSEAVNWLEGYRRFWEESLSRLDAYLATVQSKGGKHGRRKRKRS